MRSSLPKQFMLVHEKPILMYTIECFYNFDPTIEILLTLPQEWLGYWEELLVEYDFRLPHRVVIGGRERFDSIKNALEKCTGDIIGVHDGVRPLVDEKTISTCFLEAEKLGAVIPVITIAESLRRKTESGTETVDRSEYLIVQTPQCFKRDVLLLAYERPYHSGITDDASLVEESGHPIATILGNDANIKITTQADLAYAELYLR